MIRSPRRDLKMMLQRSIFKPEAMFDVLNNEVLTGDGEIRFLVTAGGTPCVEIARSLLAMTNLLHSINIPLTVRLVAVCGEDPRIDPERKNAFGRTYRLMADPPLPENLPEKDRKPEKLKGQWLEDYIDAPRRWCEEVGVPFTWECPYNEAGTDFSEAFLDLVGDAAYKIRGLASNPYYRYHPPFFRRQCGEISEPDLTKQVPVKTRDGREELRHPTVIRHLGAAFGLHFSLPGGQVAAFRQTQGPDPLREYFEARHLTGRWAITGIGPGWDRYWHADGPVFDLRLAEQFPDWAGNPVPGYPVNTANSWSLVNKGRLARAIVGESVKWIEPTLRSVLPEVLANVLYQLAEHHCGLHGPAGESPPPIDTRRLSCDPKEE